MSSKRLSGLFITGTDTSVGKTYVAARIARALVVAGKRVGVYKPVASGCRRDGGVLRSDDAEALWRAAGQPGPLAAVCPQCFAAPLAPHLAARAEGKEIDANLLRSGIESWAERSEIVIVEGAGGLMTPVGDEEYIADLAIDFGYPLIVVAPNVLGVINQTLQTLITGATFRDGLDVAGIVLNELRPTSLDTDPSVRTNLAELRRRCVPPVLAELRWQAESFEPLVDWWKIANLVLKEHSHVWPIHAAHAGQFDH